MQAERLTVYPASLASSNDKPSKIWARKYYTPPQPRKPQVTKLGTAVAPLPAAAEGKEPTLWQRDRLFLDTHHLYFPRYVFVEHGLLACEFREHRFNKVLLPRYQHERLHNRYNDWIHRYPNYLMPSEEVMAGFLDEAKLLELLNVCARSSNMLDSAFKIGKIEEAKHRELRAQKLELAEDVLLRVKNFEIVDKLIVESVIEEFSQSSTLGRLALTAAA